MKAHERLIGALKILHMAHTLEDLRIEHIISEARAKLKK